jgi:arylformamidase
MHTQNPQPQTPQRLSGVRIVEKIYRGFTRSELDAAYNNPAACPSYASLGQERTRLGAWVHDIGPRFHQIPYGVGARQTLDLVLPDVAPASGLAPLLVYLHGGYWQGGSTAAYRFLAQSWSNAGVAVALIEYTVAPAGRMAQMSEEVRTALSWLSANAQHHGVDGNAICLTGHSAGGHLTALGMAHPAVKSGVAISGLFDLEPISLCYLNEKLQLTQDDIQSYSPLRHIVQSSKPLVVAVGANELPELRRQSMEYAAACSALQCEVSHLSLAGHDHFSVVDELAYPSGELYRQARTMMGLVAEQPAA